MLLLFINCSLFWLSRVVLQDVTHIPTAIKAEQSNSLADIVLLITSIMLQIWFLLNYMHIIEAVSFLLTKQKLMTKQFYLQNNQDARCLFA